MLLPALMLAPTAVGENQLLLNKHSYLGHA